MLQHTGRFCEGCWTKDNATSLELPPYSHDLSDLDFYLFSRLKSALKMIKLLWCYWHQQECDGRAEKAFTKWLPGKFPTPLQSLAEMYSCQTGLFWRLCILNDCISLYFSDINNSGKNLKLPHIRCVDRSKHLLHLMKKWRCCTLVQNFCFLLLPTRIYITGWMRLNSCKTKQLTIFTSSVGEADFACEISGIMSLAKGMCLTLYSGKSKCHQA